MPSKIDRDFQREIDAFREALAEQGRTPGKFVGSTDEGKLKMDFDLPYSSFPRRFVKPKWKKNRSLPNHDF